MEFIPNLRLGRQILTMASSPVPFSLFAGVVFAVFVAIVHFVTPVLITYRLTVDAFEVRLLRLFRVVRIPYESIGEVRKLSISETWLPRSAGMFNAARAGNRLFVRYAVAIVRKAGLRKTLIITPANPDEFVRQIEERVRPHPGRS